MANCYMIPRRLFLRASFVAFGLVLSVSPVRAEGTLDQASAFIKDFGDRAIDALTEEGLATKELQARFGKLYEEGFDSPAISRFVLGRYWKKTTKDEREEFMALFDKFVIQTYSAKFRHYSGETFTVTGTKSEGNNVFIIASEVLQPSSDPPITLSWRVSKTNGTYRIYDITVEGVSMAITQRSEFSSVIRNGGGKITVLIDALREKTMNLASKDTEEGGNTN